MMRELQSILLSDMPLLISADGYRRLMVSAFPLVTPTEFFFESKTYEQESREAFEALRKAIGPKLRQLARQAVTARPGDDPDINLTMDYDDPDLQEDSIAYHRVFGIITASSRWYFSSQRMERDLLAAEQNPLICGHLIHVSSPGGEAWYLDRLDETLRQLEKPVVVIYEMACSAAYHIACHGRRVYATTDFDFVGCIGTMVSFYDFRDYYAKLGIREVTAKADGSDLKNKMFDDLRDGKPRQYVESVLNPLNAVFLDTVRRQRKPLASLDDDAPVLRGETYYTDAAVEVGLCDGRRTLPEAVAECWQLGREWSDSRRTRLALYNAL